MQHVGPIAGVACHENLVATVGYDNRLILWDLAARTPLARATHDHLVNACDFSRDGCWLVSASSDYTARVWSVPDLQLHTVLAGHGDDVDMACFSPDGSLIATCALDRIVRVFERSGALLQALPGHTGNVLSLAWIDAERFVTTSVDGTLREWHARSGEALRVTDLGMRTDCVAVSPGGPIYAGDDLGRIGLLCAGQAPVFVAAHRAGVKKLMLAKDSTLLISLGYDGAIAVWSLGPDGIPQERARSLLPDTIWARGAAVCADGRIVTATFGGTYALFDPTQGTWDLIGVGAGPAVNAMIEWNHALWTIGDAGLLQCDGQAAGGTGSLCNFLTAAEDRLFTGGHRGELCDARTGQVFHRHHSPLNCGVAFLRGGLPHLAVGTYTGEILLFVLAHGTPQLVRTVKAYANAVKGLATAEGLLFSVCANTDITWHAIADWRMVRRLERAHSRITNACTAMPGGGFASVGRDRMLRLWLPEGEPAFLTPHPNSVKSLASSPCGRWLASGSYGGTVAVFDRTHSAFEPMQRISKAGIAALCWSEFGQGFVAASYDGEVHAVPWSMSHGASERMAA